MIGGVDDEEVPRDHSVGRDSREQSSASPGSRPSSSRASLASGSTGSSAATRSPTDDVEIPLYKERDWTREVSETHSGNEWRSDVDRDFARLIHSASFRRLQGKTQLFPAHESDFFRNRLTHSLE